MTASLNNHQCRQSYNRLLVAALRSFAIVCVLAFSCHSRLCADEPVLPQKIGFEAYRVRPVSTKKAPIAINKQEWNDFAAELRRSYDKKSINFAGHYVLIHLNCGQGCEAAGIVDVSTGKIYALPGTISDPPELGSYDFNRIEFKKNSKLLILTGNINEANTHPGKLVRHYYLFENNTFSNLGSEVLSFDGTANKWITKPQ